MPDPSQVNAHFSKIAPAYDKANHWLSGGVDYWWRWRLTGMVKAHRPARVLDLATGSGDVAFSLKKHMQEAEVVGLDFCQPMLDQAVLKREVNGLEVEFLQGDCHGLEFEDESFDAITISFGYRNLEDRPKALDEFYRVLKPGGRLYILEFSQPYGFIRPVYFWYLRNVLPHLAKWISGNQSAYDYLSESIEAFPEVGEICNELKGAKFENISYKRPTLGVVAIHEGKK